MRRLYSLLLAGVVALGGWALPAQAEEQEGAEKKKVLFIAGYPSHSPGEHEHRAGAMLLAKALEEGVEEIETEVNWYGWPSEDNLFEGVASVVMYCDGGAGHLVNRRLHFMQELMSRGIGLVCIHYAVEVPKGEPGDRFVEWIGGYFETDWSVNPHWDAHFETLPEHPITLGVEPFTLRDEWYYHMRFPEGMEGVTPILTAMPPEESLSRPDGPHSGNPHVREAVANGEPQHVAWAIERPDGGRGFGFTGGHFHRNWRDDNFRTLVLNAIAWSAKSEIPESGVPSTTPTDEEMEENLDDKKRR